MTPSTSSDPFVALLGALAYAELTGFTDLATTSAEASSTRVRVGLARLAASEVRHFEALEDELRARGADVQEAMAPFAVIIDRFHERTRPRTWGERLVKAAIGDGLTSDFYRELAPRVGQHEQALVRDVSRAEGKAELVAHELATVLVDDPSQAGRLSLYARRLVGEAVAEARQVMLERPDLLALVAERGELEDLQGFVTRLVEANGQRMARLGLTS